MLVDDFVMRQIQKLAEMLAAIARAPAGALPEGMQDDLREAYRALLGMDPEDLELLDDAALARTLRSRAERDALVELCAIDAELRARSGDPSGARRCLDRALGLAAPDDPRAAGWRARRDALG